MLLSLHIENIAVIKSVDIDFDKGFTALTGETGAGKSIIIDSISFLLGAKADKDLIRHNEVSALVSGLFSVKNQTVLSSLKDCGVEPDEQGQIFVQRTLAEDGRSQARINSRAVNLSLLRSVAPSLIDVHGQNDAGELLDTETHIRLVDTYAANGDLLSDYSSVFLELEEVRRNISSIKERENERERLKEILEYQIKDISSLNLHDGEEEELVEKKVKIKNSEKIRKNSEFVYKALKGSDKGGVNSLVSRCITALSQLEDVIPAYKGYAETLRDIMYQTEDIAEEVYAVLEDTEGDSEEALNEIERRLDKISKLKRKYGLTVKDILDFKERASLELSTLENSEDILKELTVKEEKLYKKAYDIATELHTKREKAVIELEGRVKETLEFLDMPKVVFFAKIEKRTDGDRVALNKGGFDLLEFYISANRGAEPQPISKIASGGELARIMLAIKSILADEEGVETLIFDEIDTGVSGKTARKIGIKMRELSRHAQIISITHSAQIASLSDKHLLISKGDYDGVTETRVRELDYDGRINELSRILGGISVTESQRAAAVDMLNEKYVV